MGLLVFLKFYISFVKWVVSVVFIFILIEYEFIYFLFMVVC